MIEVYTDGACEPINPGGFAAYGVYVRELVDGNWLVLLSESRLFIPKKGREKETSNNVAEYSGLLRALEFLSENGKQASQITYRSDSKLVVYQNSIDPQFKKRWKMRGGYYVPIAKRAQKLLKKFPKLSMEWIPREQNSFADELSKKALLDAGVVFKIQPRE